MESSDECNDRPHPDRGGRPSGGAIHEGHAAVPDVWFLQPGQPGPEAGRRADPFRQRAAGSGNPRRPAAVFRLADLPAVVHQWRVHRRLRHHGRTVRKRRAGAHGGRGAESRMSSPSAPLATGSLALSDRVILVTGAYGGLGEAAAKACAQAGATVVLLGRKVPKLSRTYDAVKALGPTPALYPLDLAGADPADYEQLASTIESELGGLHGILHCAAEFTGLKPLEATAPEEFVRNLHVNLTASWLLTQACLPLLRKAADSAVVFVVDDLSRVNRAYWGTSGVDNSG